MTRTFCPAGCARARRPCRAASPETATAAACSKLSLAGLRTSLSSPRGGVFGEGAAGDAEHLVAGPEPGHAGAGRGDRARHVQPGDAVLRPAEPEAQDPHQVRLARHQMPRAPVHPGRPDLHEDLAGCDHGLVDLGQAQPISGTVDILNDRPHRLLPRRCHRGRPCLSWLGSHGNLPFGHGTSHCLPALCDSWHSVTTLSRAERLGRQGTKVPNARDN